MYLQTLQWVSEPHKTRQKELLIYVAINMANHSAMWSGYGYYMPGNEIVSFRTE